ncbi:MAG: glycosyltransferase family 4 protein [Planctomycetota bacterium]
MADRVLFVLESGGPGGLATQARGVAGELAALGYDAEWCLLDGPVASNAEPGCGRRLPADPLALRRLRRAVRQAAPAIVHAWGPTAAAYGAWAAGSAKLVVTVGRAGAAEPAWARLIHRGWRRRADAIVAPSSEVADALGPEATVVPPGVPIAEAASAEASREQLLAELRLPASARVIAIVSRMLPRKRVKELVWCADLMRVLRDEVRVLVIGDGPQLPALARFARMASDLEHVRLLGERSDLPRLLGAADVYWHAGDEQSPPLALLEAMAAGVPVVADQTPGASQTVVNNETGLLVPLGGRAERARATERLLTEPDHAAQLAANAQADIAKRYAIGRAARDYAAMYQS